MAEMIPMPKLGFDMAEGTLIRWLKGEGETITKGEVLAEIETDKATVEVESQHSGVLHRQIVPEGSVVPVGSPIAIVGEPDEKIDLEALIGEATEEAKIKDDAPVTPESTTKASEQGVESPVLEGHLPGGVKSSPLARRLASEHGIDLKSISASGQDGRIVRRDVEQAIAEREALPTGIESGVPAISKPIVEETPPEKTITIPLSKLRGIIGRRMTAAKQQVPHFYLTAEFDVEALMKLRAEINQRIKEEEKTSVNDFIVKAVALALRRFPNLNASLDDDQIKRHGDVNVGIAVAVEDGLLTIVVHHADRKSIRTISKEARMMIARAREGRVRAEDVEGATFTVSNLGMYDIENFAAIINPPEAAILAVGNVRTVPVIQNGNFIAGQRLKVTLSADHRITDGAEAAQWLQVLRGYMEDPLLLLL